MASILRSSKFVRYVAGFARNVVINTPRNFDGNFINNSHCLCGAVSSPFSSQPSIQNEQNLERSLKRIDQDVRKSGRISKRDIEDVLEEIRNCRSATTSQSLLVIRCCGNLVPEELPQVRTKLVKQIWDTLLKLNIPMDVSHYNALLRVYLENEHPFSPVEFLAEMKEKGIEPNRVTYQRLISRFCQDGDIEGATNVLEHMRQKELPVNETVFNALIIGHSQAGDMESAHAVLNIMAQAGLEPSADTYTTLLCGYARNGEIESMKSILAECETKEIYLLDKDYLDICYALALSGNEQHLQFILTKVRKAIGYNQDCINTILNLTNKAKERAGYIILMSMIRNHTSDGIPLPSGRFFIKQLVKARRPLGVILEMCDQLESDGMLDRTIVSALEVSLEIGNEELALSLMEELQKRGNEIRQHYFWPLFCQRANDEDNNNVLRILQKMKTFGIIPNNETIQEYVIPNLKGKSSDMIKVLTEANISMGTCAVNLTLSFLKSDKIQDAALLMGKVQAYYSPDVFKRPLSQAFYNTNDLKSYITIIREIYDNLDKRVHVIKDEQSIIPSKHEVIGNLIEDLSFNKKNFYENIEDVLRELVKQGLGISTESAEKIQENLGNKITNEISSLLGALSSEELVPVPLLRKQPVYTPSHQMNIPQLEKLIENCSIKKMDVRGLKRQLLTLYYRAKDLKKAEALVDELQENSDFFFTSGIYSQLMELNSYHENLEKAIHYFEKIKNSDSVLKVDDSKILHLAYLMHKKGQFEESLKLLSETPREKVSGEEEKNFNYTSLAWRFLNSLADEGRVEDLDKLFHLLISKEYMSVNNVLLGPLVKVHLVNDQLDKALDKFEECVTLYKATPWKNELTCRLIQAEDAEKLQKLTDLSTLVHGEINSLYDLVFAFIECGRVRQARKILETPGLQNRSKRLNHACERFRLEGMVKPLEDLKDATKDMNHIDRSEIYYQLLLSYIKEEDTDKAFGLWTQMQEEDLPPSDQFLITLAKYLDKKGLEVPFIIPEEKKLQKKVVSSSNNSEELHIFRSLLKSGKCIEAFNYRNNVSDKWTIIDASELIENLTQQNELDQAAKVTLELLEKRGPPVNRIFKFVVNKLALAGKLAEIEKIGEKISMNTKKIISYDNRLCHATIIAGKAEEYLSSLDNEITVANSKEELQNADDKFPRGGAYGILDLHPELLEKYEHVAKKYAEKGIIAPINVLWTHVFIKGNYEKAEQLWNEHLKQIPRIMFQRIVQAARDTNNEGLVEKLIEHLKISNITEGALGNAYSCLLDVKISKGQTEDVVSLFENILKEVNIDYLNRTAVLRVKSVYNQLGKEFSYKIPNKINKNQSSSSSSDALQH